MDQAWYRLLGLNRLEDHRVARDLCLLSILPTMIGDLLLCAALLLWPTSTSSHFVWSMSPVTAVFFGTFFAGAALGMITGLRTASWVRLREVVFPVASFVVIFTLGTAIEHDALRPEPGTFGALLRFVWFPTLALCLGSMLLAYQIQRRRIREGTAPRFTADDHSYRGPQRLALEILGWLWMLLAFALLIFLHDAEAYWPWPVTRIDLVVTVAIVASVGAGTLTQSRTRYRDQVRPYAVFVLLPAIGLLVAIFVFREAVAPSRLFVPIVLFMCSMTVLMTTFALVGTRRFVEDRNHEGSSA